MAEVDYSTKSQDELVEELTKRDSDLLLAAQLGKQLLDKTGELQGQLDELDKAYNELKANHEHLNAQYATLSTELKNADLHKGALFAEVDALRQQVKNLQREVEDKERLQAQYQETIQLLESQKQELLVAQNALDEQTKLVAKLQQERSSMALQIDSVGITANELQTMRAELTQLRAKVSLQAELDRQLGALRNENADLTSALGAQQEVEQRLVQLQARNKELEAQNAETTALLDELRATASSLADSMMHRGAADAPSSLADELRPTSTSTTTTTVIVTDDEEARRLREEKKRQQDLLALLAEQLKKTEQSMQGKQKEAEQLRRELIKREQARKSGYLHKRGYYFATWKRRFCLLDSAYLHYGDSPNRSFEGVVLLRGAKVEHSPDTLARRAHCFSLSNSNRTYYFAADTEEEMVDWIVSLMAVIKEANNPSPTAELIRSEAGTAFADPKRRAAADSERLALGVFENERRATPLSSFAPTTMKWSDRPQWSDFDGVDACGVGGAFSDNQSPSVKNGWTVVTNVAMRALPLSPRASVAGLAPQEDRPGFTRVEKLATNTDYDGWEYAFGFSSDEWTADCSPGCFVRRRRWLKRDAIAVIAQDGDPLLSVLKKRHDDEQKPAIVAGSKPVVAKATNSVTATVSATTTTTTTTTAPTATTAKTPVKAAPAPTKD